MFYLDEGEFAEAGAALRVSDGNLPVVFNPPPSTEDVVYAGSDFVPLIVISKPTSSDEFIFWELLIYVQRSIDLMGKQQLFQRIFNIPV